MLDPEDRVPPRRINQFPESSPRNGVGVLSQGNARLYATFVRRTTPLSSHFCVFLGNNAIIAASS
jgi:hypothetical protein